MRDRWFESIPLQRRVHVSRDFALPPREAGFLHGYLGPAGAARSGSEVVLCTSGTITLHQEGADDSRLTTILRPGQYAINDPGTRHTADVEVEASALFITAGIGTQHRPR